MSFDKILIESIFESKQPSMKEMDIYLRQFATSREEKSAINHIDSFSELKNMEIKNEPPFLFYREEHKDEEQDATFKGEEIEEIKGFY